MDLTVVIPAYNEADRIRPTLASVRNYLEASQYSYEIIVVNDGSADDTAKLVSDFAEQHKTISLITYNQNRGKGFAVKQGVLAAQGNFVLINDADGSSPISEIERLMNALRLGADLAIGSRNLSSDECITITSPHRKFIGNSFNFFVRLLLLPGINDTQCGFKLFKSAVAKKLFYSARQNRFAFDLEILAIARSHKFKILEVPINWNNVTGSKVNLFTDPFDMFFVLLQMSVRNFLWRSQTTMSPTLPQGFLERKKLERTNKGL